MPKIRNVFLDDGGVMNDNSLRGPQWQRLVGEFFAPRLGGSEEDWAAANGALFGPVLDRLEERLRDWSPALGPLRRAYELYDLDWLDVMCTALGLAQPATEDERLALVAESTRQIMPRVKAAYPGAIETIRQIAGEHRLFTASMGPSWELELTIGGMGVTDCFERLYGPDLVDMQKQHPAYYARLFEDAGVEAAESLVVDDRSAMLANAAAAGAHVVLVGHASSEWPSIRSLAELPSLVPELSR